MADKQGSQEGQGEDDFTRKYLQFLIGLVLVGFFWWFSSFDFRAMEINDLLEVDADVAAYPYPFRVILVEDGVAEVSSPRSSQFSAVKSLRVMYPELKRVSVVSDEMMAAQGELARVQSHVGELVKSQDDVDSVRWVLDRQWLVGNGAQIF
jgi:hypothetical protein